MYQDMRSMIGEEEELRRIKNGDVSSATLRIVFLMLARGIYCDKGMDDMCQDLVIGEEEEVRRVKNYFV